MKAFFRSLAAAGFALALIAVGLPTDVFGQAAQQMTQTSTRLDASTGLYGPLGGATNSCAATGSSAANNTVTITPPAGQYVYVTGVYIDITATAVATTQVATMSVTNMGGAGFWSLATIVPTAGATGGVFRQISETYGTPLRSAAPGTAVVFAPSGAVFTNTIVCTRVAAYFGL